MSNKGNTHYQEWELLREPVNISKLDPIDKLPEGNNKMTIYRNSRQHLEGKMFPSGYFELEYEKPGTFSKDFDMTGSDLNGRIKYVITGCFFNSHKSQYQIGEPIVQEVGLTLRSLTRTNFEAETDCLIEWCLNGPSNKSVYLDGLTTREGPQKGIIERKSRKYGDVYNVEIKRDGSTQHSGDFLLIQTTEFKCIISELKDIGPEWSNNIGIEYRQEWSKIPSAQEREEIRDLASFVFGKPIIHIGSTEYDSNAFLIRETATKPTVPNPVITCKRKETPPIRVNQFNSERCGEIISQLLPVYKAKIQETELDYALWNFQIADEIPVGTNFPIYFATIESLMNHAFLREESRSVYMSAFQYRGLVQKELEDIRRKLEQHFQSVSEEHRYNTQMHEAISNAHRIGVSARLRMFLEHIGIELTDTEKEAIDKRHAFAHGRKPHPAEYQDIVLFDFAYKTLINKLFLKLLNYSGEMIDYTKTGHPTVII